MTPAVQSNFERNDWLPRPRYHKSCWSYLDNASFIPGPAGRRQRPRTTGVVIYLIHCIALFAVSLYRRTT